MHWTQFNIRNVLSIVYVVLPIENKAKPATPASPEIVFKVPAIPPVRPAVGPQRPTHRRTTSEVAEASQPTHKWRQYEKRQQSNITKPDPVPESRCALASLSLENFGMTLSVEDICSLQEVKQVSQVFLIDESTLRNNTVLVIRVQILF